VPHDWDSFLKGGIWMTKGLLVAGGRINGTVNAHHNQKGGFGQ
jgi:hypothetical protein